jgi:DNA-binding transcriptional regulator YhcF (GntR family)
MGYLKELPNRRQVSVHSGTGKKHQVSVQTVQKAIGKLEESGYITVKQKAGIIISSLDPSWVKLQKKSRLFHPMMISVL